VEEPIQIVIEAAPLWERLLTIFIPLVGGALAVLAGMMVERRRGRVARRREHHREIQDRVFRLLEQKIREYFLPILQAGTCNIELRQRLDARAAAAATDYLFERTDELAIVRPDLSTIEVPSRALYDCSKRVHYPEVIRQYESLEANISDYQSQCLEYVQSLVAKIRQDIGLSDQPPPPWMRPEALALHIYQRQLGLEPHGVKLRDAKKQPTNTVELPGGSGVIIEVTQAQASKALELVTELENSRERLDKLTSEAASLQPRADAPRDDLERLLHASGLVGKCDFLSE